jgi:hypothetical protein
VLRAALYASAAERHIDGCGVHRLFQPPLTARLQRPDPSSHIGHALHHNRRGSTGDSALGFLDEQFLPALKGCDTLLKVAQFVPQSGHASNELLNVLKDVLDPARELPDPA